MSIRHTTHGLQGEKQEDFIYAMNDGEHETIPPLERIEKSIIVLGSEKVLLDAALN
jgi:hypothetical protein